MILDIPEVHLFVYAAALSTGDLHRCTVRKGSPGATGRLGRCRPTDRPRESAPVSDRIDLWSVDLDRWAGPGGERLAADTLTDDDRVQAARLDGGPASIRLLARRSATRAVLAATLGTDPDRLAIERWCGHCGSAGHGRPVLIGRPVDFSVSSSHGLAVVAVSDASVGTDVEILREDSVVVDRALTDGERLRLAELPPGDRVRGFLRLWTAKEAVLKVVGRGIGGDPAVVDVFGLVSDNAVRTVDDGRSWAVRQEPAEPFEGQPVLLAVADEVGRPLHRHVLAR